MTAPCRGCPDRDYPHCHMVCPKYAAYRAERDAIRRRKRREYRQRAKERAKANDEP